MQPVYFTLDNYRIIVCSRPDDIRLRHFTVLITPFDKPFDPPMICHIPDDIEWNEACVLIRKMIIERRDIIDEYKAVWRIVTDTRKKLREVFDTRQQCVRIANALRAEGYKCITDETVVYIEKP